MVEIRYMQLEQNREYECIIKQVIKACFKEENLIKKNVEINIILTIPEKIQEINKRYRNVDKPTDVLSFPMFEKEEVEIIQKNGTSVPEILGDIIISIDQVKRQAEEYGHSIQRELAYMTVHGFYHIMGYDHVENEEKIKMRNKEEKVLEKLGLER